MRLRQLPSDRPLTEGFVFVAVYRFPPIHLSRFPAVAGIIRILGHEMLELCDGDKI